MSPIFLRSSFSLMQGTSSPAKLCARAKKFGYTHPALIDRDSLIGLLPFLAACRQHRLRPLVGAELTDPHSSDSIICLVKNKRGYAHLCNLITKRKTDAKGEKKFSLLEEIAARNTGLLILTRSLPLLRQWRDCEVDLGVDLGDRPTEQGGKLRKWALKNTIPAVATPKAIMARQGETSLYLLMQAIRTNRRFDPREIQTKSHQNQPTWLEPPAVYQNRFAVWPEVLEATRRIPARCAFSGPKFGIVMPPWKVEGKKAAPALRLAAYQGACKRYGTDLSEAVVERLEHELQVIDSMGFSSYFLVVRDIVSRAVTKTKGRSLRICGRGSGAASLVAYCLEITNVCPLKHNLYFERFLNPGRSDPPDIDIDFAWDERDAVLNQVLKRHGNHAAMVSTTICFKPRMAIRETAKAFGLPPGEISAVTKKIPHFHRNNGCSLLAWMRELPALKGESLAAPWPEIIHLAADLVGIPRYLSVHPGGVVITPRPVSDYVPVEPAAKGVPIIQWGKDAAEEAGLVKIDLLGNRSLGVIRDCIASLTEERRDFDEEYWQPEEDFKTKEAVAKGRTMGCFYIESPAMRLLQQKAATGSFEQLVLQSSIIRPAANEYIREYVRRLHGGSWDHLHPLLAEVLDETFGIMVYQEDVSRVAVALAGFSHARADGLRKVISKKDRELRLRDYHREFDEGCTVRGIDQETRKKLWQMMMSFDGYSFCKPHSASYARVSFQAAYLKTHHPAEFMAAVISNQGGYYSTFAYVSEAKRMGLQILPPCVQKSSIRWQGKGKKIRVGLMAVKGISSEVMKKIIVARGEKNFSSTVDFWQRVQVPDDQCRTLIHSGAMDSISCDGNKTRLLWELAQFRSLTKARKNSSLFPIRLPPAPNLQPVPHWEQLRREYRALGFLCNNHPLLLYKHKLQGRIRARDLKKYRGKQVSFAGWLITGKLVSTKTGEVMEFLTFEDETGLVETTFFPKVYRRYASRLFSGQPYMLKGTVEEEYGAVTLTVQHVRRL